PATAGEERFRREPRRRVRARQPAVLSLVQRHDTRQTVVRRIEGRVFHAERIEDALLQELIEGERGRDFDDAPECLDACERAVAPLRAGLEVEWHDTQGRNVSRET